MDQRKGRKAVKQFEGVGNRDPGPSSTGLTLSGSCEQPRNENSPAAQRRQADYSAICETTLVAPCASKARSIAGSDCNRERRPLKSRAEILKHGLGGAAPNFKCSGRAESRRAVIENDAGASLSVDTSSANVWARVSLRVPDSRFSARPAAPLSPTNVTP